MNSSITELPNIGNAYKTRLEKLNITTIDQLLLHLPRRYLDLSKLSTISSAQIGDLVTIRGEITSALNQYSKRGIQMQIFHLKDDTGSIEIIFFNQRYLLSMLKKGIKTIISGEVTWFAKKKAMISPEFELEIEGKEAIHTGRLLPIYPETKGVSSKWFRTRFKQLHDDNYFNTPVEYIPIDVLQKNNLPEIDIAFKMAHFPETIDDVNLARKRIALNEFIMLQMEGRNRKNHWKKTKNANEMKVSSEMIKDFTKNLPFELTNAQQNAISDISNDLTKPFPMNRLLEGDVGSGKTVVAAAAIYISFRNGFQSVIMAPTQILAKQHFLSLSEIFKSYNLKVELFTSNTKSANFDSVDVFVGTHALLFEKVNFDRMSLVIIDEQHRFGVDQRAKLIKKSKNTELAPDVLAMTATPIPRTVALTAYGDLDLSILDELPKGRKTITTWIVPENKRSGAYEWIKNQIENEKIQVFVVCPFIDESEDLLLNEVKSVKIEYEKIKKNFSKFKIGLLHSKLKPKEKDLVIESFKNGKIDILVSTPVIEVGVDVPNANIMIIESSDRFGLAQLHQLRGRVGRGTKKSYCLLFSDSKSPKAKERLGALKKSMSGFELAELDLKLRGPGEIFGTEQSGFPELIAGSWADEEIIKLSTKIVDDAFENPKKYAKLIEIASNHGEDIK